MSTEESALTVSRADLRCHWMMAVVFTLFWAGFAGAVSAAKIVDLSVNPREDSTEVIFVLDSPAGYRLERNQTTGQRDPDELLLAIDAEASDRELQTRSGLVSLLTVHGGGNDPTKIRITLREPGLVVRDSVLVNPPRLVLNISRPSGTEAVNRVESPAAPAAFARPAKASSALPPPAESSSARVGNLREVRVGSHPTFSRLVFELDAPASYRLDQSNRFELLVTLDASSKRLDIRSMSKFISSVSVAKEDEKTLARVRLNGNDLQIKEFVLSNPYRIVIDIGKRTPSKEVELGKAELPTLLTP